MEQTVPKGNKITWIVSGIVFVILVLIAVLLITQTGKKTESMPVIIESYDSIYNAELKYGDSLFLNRNGYATINLQPGDYLLKYELTQCSNPSLSYTASSQGQSVTYDPLKEKIAIDSSGRLVTQGLPPSEKTEALLREEVYVVETEGTRPVIREATISSNTLGILFSTDGKIKVLFRAKCDDAQLVAKIYTA